MLPVLSIVRSRQAGEAAHCPGVRIMCVESKTATGTMLWLSSGDIKSTGRG